MPELPDVEHYRRIVQAHAIGQTIRRVRTADAGIVSNPPASLGDLLIDRTIRAAQRHGKWLTIVTDGSRLLVHFGMTGVLRWSADNSTDPQDRFTVELDNGSLAVSDRRNLATVAAQQSTSDPTEITGPLGPDARTVTVDDLGALLRRSRSSLKAVLLDQTKVAGLGNMLTDEILWRARLDPTLRAADLDDREITRLHRALRSVLTLAVAAGHIPRGPTWLSGQRNADTPICPRCGQQLERRRLGGRTSLWCPHCQAITGQEP